VTKGEVQEFSFDGLVGPTHNYAGLSRGNLASGKSRGHVSNPRAAALQGLAKMAYLMELGVGQAILPPQPRPDVDTLRRCGFSGSDEDVIRRAARDAPELLGRTSSSSSMWTANAATVAPSRDTTDRRVHLVPANLVHMFHRSIEARQTTRILEAIFGNQRHFAVHSPLPAHQELSDEGAANHTRLFSEQGSLQLFCWGRDPSVTGPTVHPARQTLDASRAVARALGLRREVASFWQQQPLGIDSGAFHSDVLMVGNGAFLMLHEHALVDESALLDRLRAALGSEFRAVVASDEELPLRDAVDAYPFNSQIVTLEDGTMRIIAPLECRDNPAASAFLERVVREDNPVARVDYIDVRQSMSNGGGPACLRLRVALEAAERNAISANVFLTPQLRSELGSWIERHYRDQLTFDDLADPALLREGRTALDELTRILGLGSLYDFQGSPASTSS
jgi:succinylarginine dihydrolase